MVILHIFIFEFYILDLALRPRGREASGFQGIAPPRPPLLLSLPAGSCPPPSLPSPLSLLFLLALSLPSPSSSLPSGLLFLSPSFGVRYPGVSAWRPPLSVTV